MISALGRFGELRVLARGVTSAYAGRTPNAIDPGRALGVDYAVDGSYWGAIGTAEYKRIQTKSITELTPYECIVQGVIGTSTDITVPEGARLP
jgi:hypothetical protein